MPELPESIVASGPREYDVARYRRDRPSPHEPEICWPDGRSGRALDITRAEVRQG